jgi:signal transduction histidine kinase
MASPTGEIPRDAEKMSSDRSVIAALIELASVDRGDWDSSIQHILRVEARVLDVERMSFWTVRNEEKLLFCEMAYHRTTGVFERGATLATSQHADFVEAIGRSAPLDVPDVRNDPRVQSLRDYFATRGVSSLLCFPIRAQQKLAGLICLEHVGPPRRWSASDERFAEAVAETATATLEARARTEAQEGARRRSAFLDQTSRTLGETLEVDAVARRATALAVPRLADGVEIDLVEEGGIRRLAYDYAGPGRALIEAALSDRTLEPGRQPYIVDVVLSHRGSLLVSDINDEAFADAELHDPKLGAALRSVGTRSLMSAPLVISERIIGVITFITASRRYGLDDLGLAEEFARRLAAALVNALLHQRAQDAVRVRDEFISLAGHELRTPLTALQLSAQELVRRSPSAPRDEIEHCAESMVRQIKRLDRLSTRMLDATHISTKQRLPLVRAPADLSEIARDAAEAFAPLLRQHGCSLLVRADAPVLGEWDATQLEQVLGSLLDNAAKFGAGKPVEITAWREGADAVLSVRDHGPGIPPDRVRRIFEPFERAVSATHYGGLGLGLYVAKAIVEEHGGALTVDSREGEGATFTARLPVAG